MLQSLRVKFYLLLGTTAYLTRNHVHATTNYTIAFTDKLNY